MIAALVYSVIPPFVLGRMKLPLAAELHDKTLQTDANLNKGDWLTGIAGIFARHQHRAGACNPVSSRRVT